nr:hypothetical protein [Tanacetum cinerariifolium]GEX03130.1 hypothetical protein [Tanacetum cinerariifolium]
MSQEIVHIVANSVDILDVKKSCVNNCNKRLELETELFKKKDFIEKEAYDKLVKSYSNLEKHCELANQLNQEIFQRENFDENLNAPTFNQLFKINELKARSQEKDTVIRKLKERTKSLSGKDSVENVKKDIDKIETINIELKHSVAKLLSENENLRKEREHLKSIYKYQYLNTQLQEKVFAIIALKNELRKRKGKFFVNAAVLKPNATIAPGMFKLDIEPISPRLKNNKDVHEPSGNTKNNRITRPPRSNQKNKVEDHPRKVKSSLNKMNFISEPISNVPVKHSVRNAKFESICAICNECLFDTNHDMYLVDFVNVRSKSKSKRNKKRCKNELILIGLVCED